MMYIKKIKKFFRQPSIFFRDYLNKKYPVRHIEQPYLENEEIFAIQLDAKLANLTADILPNFPVDVVFTWVDGSDSKWQQKYRQAIHTQSPQNIGLYANDMARFSNHNELYYSIRSVQQFMPWVRYIFIITDEQIPTWLDLNEQTQIKIIDHRQIIDKQYLPTFNSHVIEAHLHQIPELSEHIIYFNDDVFVARYLAFEHFFQKNGLASIFLADKSIEMMQAKNILTPTLSATKNSMALLEKDYSCRLDKPLVHTYSVLIKSAYQLAWQRYPNEIESFLKNKFRGFNDLNFSNFLIPWLMYLEGKSYPKKEICYYFNIRSANAPYIYGKLLEKQKNGSMPHSFCANDFNSISGIPDYQGQLFRFLEAYYRYP